ncbi:Pentatricopeptide repeat-containing protein [Platanthera guangdongensis]|uniref:Pentatricopeptide repeat-containing protein n=1 Tax=Platanthera guangdongensis TaxID=2320717 RepID=A0ABR2MVY8_9ASPA
MALYPRIRTLNLHLRHLSSSAAAAGSPSSILSPSDPSAILTSKQKSRAALSLLRSETDPSRIVDICRAAALTPDSHLDRTALSSAVTKLSSSQSFSSIRSLVDDLLLPRHLSHAIVLFAQAGMLDDSLRAFRTSPSQRSLNALLFACIVSNNHSQLSKFFTEYPSIYSITPNLETYNTVLKSFSESGTSRSFYSVFDEMLKRNIKPNMTTFCIALEGFYKEQRFGDVDKVLELMRSHGCSPNLATYNARILGLTKLGKSELARELFDELKKKNMKPSWVTYGHLIVGFCKEGNLEEAKRFYRSMRRNGSVAESWVYFSLMNYLCKGGDYEAAMGICNDTMARNWVPCFVSMKTLVNGLASSSKLDEAKDLIEKVKGRFPKAADMWKEVEEGLVN